MFPQNIFLSNPPSEYEEKLKILLKQSRFEHNFKQNHQKQIIQLNLEQKYVDSILTQQSLNSIIQIKKLLENYPSFDTVIVAPLRKSLQTCYELFKTQIQVQSNNYQKKSLIFYIQPFLADRLNSTHSIGESSQSKFSEKHQKYSKFFHNFDEIMENLHWINKILPDRFKNMKPLATSQAIKLLKSTENSENSEYRNCIETQREFISRIKDLKDTLLQYQQMSGSGKKLLIIASSQVLNHLAATDFHENGEPVNPQRMDFGSIEIVSLVVNGLKIAEQLDSDSILPFC